LPRRPPHLLPAVHDATATDLADHTLLPAAAGQAGQVLQYTGTPSWILPGGQGRRDATIATGAHIASDGRSWYPATRDAATNSYYPADFARTLFILPVHDPMIRTGGTLTVTFQLYLQCLRANVRAHWVLSVDFGTLPSQTEPAPTGTNLDTIVWNSTESLTQRLVASSIGAAHKFGIRVRRSAGGILTADRFRYSAWEGGATPPTATTFALRARLSRFDTDPAPVSDLPVGHLLWGIGNSTSVIS
jgi:hypothetical protein